MNFTMNNETHHTNDEHIAELSDIFSLLGDPTRLRLVLCCLNEPFAVTQIAQRLGVSTSLVSHHLRLLRAARLVRAERRGKQVFCQVTDDHIRVMLLNLLAHIEEPHDD
ncbi:transcriptional regulator [Formosimonas limnophila]|uniref:Transcriptional regulator n=2 Tax=Formosimonas limnophila TaxID=1384487 RepID=A0A8J3CMF1_9BURK|nr:transcriptional regulator [Formosimonas limnophila]